MAGIRIRSELRSAHIVVTETEGDDHAISGGNMISQTIKAGNQPTHRRGLAIKPLRRSRGVVIGMTGVAE
jgi:hypothetical protein